jgi:SAM-dependent methyltransferase
VASNLAAAPNLSYLCCPYPDHGQLSQLDDELECLTCKRRFPCVNNRPILLDIDRSIFSPAEVASLQDKRQFPSVRGWKYRIRRLLPATTSRSGQESLSELKKHVRDLLPRQPLIVVVGCGFTKALHEQLFPSARLIFTDVTLLGDADIVCDGNCLPFPDGSIDCVVIDQVLEHVLSPTGVIAEINRCLRPGGIVYSGIPFYYPIHGYPFDFQRFTPLGHRMLWRNFSQLYFRAAQGAIPALSLTSIACATALSSSLWWKRLASGAVRLMFRPLLILDRQLPWRDVQVPTDSTFIGTKENVQVSLQTAIRDIRN